jgi:aspartate aminotransferase
MTKEIAVSRRLSALHQSAVLNMGLKVAALRRQGIDVINLALGEPDLDTPAHVREAAKRAIDGGETRYTELFGTYPLRQAIIGWLKAGHGVELVIDQVMVSSGAKQVLFNLFLALLDEGDEVVMCSPLWTSYPDLVIAAGGRPVIVPTEPERGFVPDVEEVARAVTKRTRAVLLTSPCNPTGAVYPESLVKALCALCARDNLVVITDDIYRELYSDRPPPSVLRLAVEAGAPYVVVDGVSKTYCMTGWRIGFCATQPQLIKAMGVIQSQSTSCAASVSQAAALAALTGPQACVAALREEFTARRRLIVEGVRALPRMRLPVEPAGAFYLMADARGLLGAEKPDGQVLADDIQLASYLLETAHVAVNAGSGFDAPGFLRLAYTRERAQITAALERMDRALAALH